MPRGLRRSRTFSDYRPDLAALDAYVADNAGAGLLAEETSFGVTLLAPVAEGADEAAQAAAQRKADFQAAYEDGAKARREWLAAHVGDPKSMRRTALALTAFAMEAEAVESFEELLGRPIDRTPTELAVAMGLAGSVEHERLDGLEPHGRRQLRVPQPSEGRERDHHLRGHEGRRLRAERGRDGNLRGVHGAPGKRGVNERSS